jgi:hypothetical protein
MSGEITGKFLSFSLREIEEINTWLVDNGYTADDIGLKDALFDMIYEDSEEIEEDPVSRVTGMAHDFIEKNPAVIMAGVLGANNLLKKFTRKK